MNGMLLSSHIIFAFMLPLRLLVTPFRKGTSLFLRHLALFFPPSCRIFAAFVNFHASQHGLLCLKFEKYMKNATGFYLNPSITC
jgi:hypothetical protein